MSRLVVKERLFLKKTEATVRVIKTDEGVKNVAKWEIGFLLNPQNRGKLTWYAATMSEQGRREIGKYVKAT